MNAAVKDLIQLGVSLTVWTAVLLFVWAVLPFTWALGATVVLVLYNLTPR